jgi:hypothetical protein
MEIKKRAADEDFLGCSHGSSGKERYWVVDESCSEA